MFSPTVLARLCLISCLLILLSITVCGKHSMHEYWDRSSSFHYLKPDSLSQKQYIPGTIYSAFDEAMEKMYQAYILEKADINDLWKIAEYGRIYEQIAENDHADLQTTSLWQIRTHLGDDQCLIAFYQQDPGKRVPGRLYTFIITKEQVLLHTRSEVDIKGLLENYLAQLSKPPSRFWHREEFLYNLLITDSLGWNMRKTLLGNTHLTKYERLVIIPHKELYKIPFSALPSRKVDMNSLHSWEAYPFLIKSTHISYAFSGSWWMSGQGVADANTGILYIPEMDIGQIEKDHTNIQHGILPISDLRQLRTSILSQPFQWLYVGMHGNVSGQELPDFSEYMLDGKSVILAMCSSNKLYSNDNNKQSGLLEQLARSGADNICGSIWNVPDIQTGSIFITLFENNGADITDLKNFTDRYFNQANSILHHPYYWAAWMMFSKRKQRPT